ncbi:hypothetical protein MPSEU_000490800 [Mayamaea pseudoterrestris]|nr:hypothetical protein MPSEU_000490800 [Mayamaea pseudoterrestris]
MATKFADISKPTKDLLLEDYPTKLLLKCKKLAGPVALTIETEAGKGGSLTSKLSHKFSYAKFNVDKLAHAADGSHTLETSLAVSPEIKLAFKASKGADLCVDYVKGNLYVASVLDVMDMSKISTSACLGIPAQGLRVGGGATYNINNGNISDFVVGSSYAKGPIFASLTATSQLSTYNMGLVYMVNKDLVVGSQTVHTADKACTVAALGGSFFAPNVGLIKAKMSSGGVVSACVTRQIASGVLMTAGGTLTGADLSTFKPGVTLQL